MANAEIDALMEELESLNASPKGTHGDLKDGLALGIDADKSNEFSLSSPSSPVCPLKRRPLRVSKDSPSERSASPATVGSDGTPSVDSSDYLSPRPPLVPKRKSDRSPGTASIDPSVSQSHMSPLNAGKRESKGDLFRNKGETEDGNTDLELELENLLNAGQSSNNSSPCRNKDIQDRSTSHSGGSEQGLLDVAGVVSLNVDDFDDTPRSADENETPNVDADVLNSAREPNLEPDIESVTLEVESALRSPQKKSLLGQQQQPQRDDRLPGEPREAREAPEEDECGGTRRFTPLPIIGILSHPNKKKCIKVTIHGGANASRGCKESSFARNTCCSNLLCVKCNFSVVTFTDAAWQKDVDYMFFRNSNCDSNRLSGYLKDEKNHAAYCCQCSWITCEDSEAEPTLLGLQWCCAGHVSDQV